MKCGHLIHVDCSKMLQDINCPTCGMANYKLSKKEIERIDKKIAETKDNLPAELKDLKVNVMCNECLHKTSNAPFHFYGIKCGSCGTYNTKQI